MPPPPTTPARSSDLIKTNTPCILQKDVEVKVKEISIYLELENKVYKLIKGTEVVTQGNPTPAVWTGSTEPLSAHNASYRISAIMNLQVYEPISQEISYRTNLFRHSNLQPLDRALDTSKPIPQGTIVSVKKRVLDPKGEEKASASELLRIKSKLPFSPMAGIEVTGKSLTLSTASYTVERVAKAKRDFEVFNFLKVMHADLKKVE